MSESTPEGTVGCLNTNAPRELAVFDFDNTLINNQTGIIFTRYLLEKGYVSRATVAKVIAWGARYFVRLPVNQRKVREYIFRDLKGMKTAEFDRISKDFVAMVITRCYRADALRTVAKRRREGCVTLLASATFFEVVRDVAERLSMDGAVGTVMETDSSGCFTGKVRGEVVEGPNKLLSVRAWADEHLGPGRWNLAYAYGDHYSDFKMLAQADHPVAVHPSASLFAKALMHDWPIEQWR